MRKRKRERFTFEAEGDPKTQEVFSVRINGKEPREEYLVVAVSPDGKRSHLFCALRGEEESHLMDHVRAVFVDYAKALAGGAEPFECIVCGAEVQLEPVPARAAAKKRRSPAARLRGNLRLLRGGTEPAAPSRRTQPFTKKM